MDNTYWYKQPVEQPLFPELSWSKPVNKQHAGKLLIIGGNVHGFAAVAEAYNETVSAGIGTARVLLPNAVQKIIGRVFENGEFAASTPSGSFAQKAFGDFLEMSSWADGVLIAGDLGRNSETAILLEQYMQKYSGQLTLTKDAADYFTKSAQVIAERPNTTLVLSVAQLQQIAQNLHFELPITFGMDLLHLVEALHKFTEKFGINIVVSHLGALFVAVNGLVSTTKCVNNNDRWRVKTASHTCVWWLQNPTKSFEAMTSAVINYS